jgi:pyruvate/2-oxoacid:ferredoxin oxidoreductase alpha subunit
MAVLTFGSGEMSAAVSPDVSVAQRAARLLGGDVWISADRSVVVAVPRRYEPGMEALRPAGVRDRGMDPSPEAEYRYEPSDEVAPMVRYGSGRPVRFTGSTHDEHAFITKDPPTVGALNRHLIDKIEQHRDEIEMVDADLQEGANTLVVSYGSTAAAMRSAVGGLRAGGRAVSMATVHSLWPLPEAALGAAFGAVDRVVVAELNPGLYAREIERLAPGCEVVPVNRIDGEMLTPEEIAGAVS